MLFSIITLNWDILTKNLVIFKKMACTQGWKVSVLNRPDDGLHINYNWIRKDIDEVDEDHEGPLPY